MALLSGLEAIDPLLQSTSLAHVSLTLSSLCPTVDSLTAALRELTQAPSFEQSAMYPKLQQSTAERFSQALQQMQLR